MTLEIAKGLTDTVHSHAAIAEGLARVTGLGTDKMVLGVVVGGLAVPARVGGEVDDRDGAVPAVSAGAVAGNSLGNLGLGNSLWDGRGRDGEDEGREG